MINLVEILNQASLNKAEQPDDPAELLSGHYALCRGDTSDESSEQSKYNKRIDQIRNELKEICIEIECKQTDITCHEIKMTSNKPIKHRIRPVPYNRPEEFHQIIKDQLAASIIRPSDSATCSPVNLLLKEDGSLSLTIDYREVNNAMIAKYALCISTTSSCSQKISKNTSNDSKVSSKD